MFPRARPSSAFYGNSSNLGVYRRAEPLRTSLPRREHSLPATSLGPPGFKVPTLPTRQQHAQQLRHRGGAMDGKRKTSADGVDRRTPEEKLRDVQKIFHIFPRWYVCIC